MRWVTWCAAALAAVVLSSINCGASDREAASAGPAGAGGHGNADDSKHSIADGASTYSVPTSPLPSGSLTGTGPAGPAGTGGFAGAGGAESIDIPESCQQLPQGPRVFVMSADDSNSMGSPAYAREVLTGSKTKSAPDPASIKTHEFLNYYNVHYPAHTDRLLGLTLEAEAGELYYRFQVGVQASAPSSPRRPLTVTLVVDTSSSMTGEGMLRARSVMRAIADNLKAGDRVSLVTWNPDITPQLDGFEMDGKNGPIVKAAIDKVYAAGDADLQAALVNGYTLAKKYRGSDRLNRVVFITDGSVVVSDTERAYVRQNAEQGELEGIYLVGVGTGPAKGYSHALLDNLTEVGRGAYVYIDSEAEANKLFSTRFDEVMDVAARNVRLELMLPWYFDIQDFYGEEFSTDPTTVEGQHIAPGDVMIFNQVIRPCAPMVVQPTDFVTARIVWEVPGTGVPVLEEAITTLSIAEITSKPSPQLEKAGAIIAYAEALKALDGKRFNDANERINQALVALPGDPDLLEIQGLLNLHPANPPPAP